MHRLIAALYERLLGIRITTARQHVDDLQTMLADLCEARALLETEIEHTAARLLDAHARLDALTQRATQTGEPAHV